MQSMHNFIPESIRNQSTKSVLKCQSRWLNNHAGTIWCHTYSSSLYNGEPKRGTILSTTSKKCFCKSPLVLFPSSLDTRLISLEIYYQSIKEYITIKKPACLPIIATACNCYNKKLLVCGYSSPFSDISFVTPEWNQHSFTDICLQKVIWYCW